MLIGARSGLGAVLVLGLALGIPASRAQDSNPSNSTPQAARPWTDPPVRGSTNPAAPAPDRPSAAETPVVRAETAPRSRGARRTSRRTVTAEARPRSRAVRRQENRQASRQASRQPSRRVTMSTLHPTRARASAAPRSGAYAATALPGRYAAPYPGAYPAGIFARPVYGYTLADDRARRIEAAQRAGYIVVHSRSVQFPDGRSLRTYRPYEAPDEEE
ncbi:hypothetical protein [Methylobacterium planeticum]|uniref:Antifreeze protein n=1 Tax=Methylobacterium planeticum TaxID=2615211 RepID=A0A6N6MJI1_9HYPH|nr:hypothetical protein [Methylobacterium planeticum]KAB1070150.1 hypothetical protein F6X51_23555 [Methylobacterium planeticum]